MQKPAGYNDIPDPEKQREYLLGKLQTYVESITQRDPVWHQYYLCPFPECKNREHSNSTGGAFCLYGKGRKKWKCQSCNKQGNIFDLIGYMNNYKKRDYYGKHLTKAEEDDKRDEYKLEYAKACELYGVYPEANLSGDNTAAAKDAAASSSPAGSEQPAATTPDHNSEPESAAPTEGKYKDLIERCIKECTPDSKGYKYLTESRGFTPETIKRFMLGYDPNKGSEGVISIPYDSLSFSYVEGRYIGQPPEGKGKYSLPEKTEQPVYNEMALYKDNYCFVCEGAMDAISIMQAGGSAISVGGAAKWNKLTKLIEEGKRPQRCLILCFDRDEAGENGQQDLGERLSALNVPFICAEFSLDKYGSKQHDCNELLISNPEQLAADILHNLKSAKTHELETGSGLYSVSEYADLFKAHRTEDKARISTGYANLDRAFNGGFSNELYVLSAETSTGKSAIACTLAQNIAQQGIDVLYYALEMGRDEFIARGASMISKEHDDKPIPYGDILNYKWDEYSKEFYRIPYTQYEPYVKEYMERYGKHLYFIEGGIQQRTALEISETVKAFKQKHNINQLVIVVDYLQRLTFYDEKGRTPDLMTVMSKSIMSLSNLATQGQNTVIAISSISNSMSGQVITAEAGKYSGDIAYSGGVLLGWNWVGYTYKPSENGKDSLLLKEYTGKSKEQIVDMCRENGYRLMMLEVLKQRSGERDNKLYLYYYPKYNFFSALPAEGRNAKPHKK